jgi:hypothetical protein
MEERNDWTEARRKFLTCWMDMEDVVKPKDLGLTLANLVIVASHRIGGDERSAKIIEELSQWAAKIVDPSGEIRKEIADETVARWAVEQRQWIEERLYGEKGMVTMTLQTPGGSGHAPGARRGAPGDDFQPWGGVV